MKHTLTHSEDNKGWTSFWEYFPDWFLNINNKFLTIKNGQLWLQNDESNSIKNNFYDAQKKTSIKTVFNEAMAEDKIFKTLVQESNEKWRAILKTNLTEGEIKQAMSKIDNGTYSSPEAMMKTGMSIMNMASNAGQVYTGAALTGVGIVSGILEGAAKAKAAREANEERERQRKLAEAREKEIRQAVKNARLSLFSHFKNGELPVSSTTSLTQNLYYFVYAYQSNEMLQDRASVVLSKDRKSVG
jgi:hypothetical protein